MSKPDITVYGAYWCPDCRQSKQFLGEHQIPYNWVNIEEDKDFILKNFATVSSKELREVIQDFIVKSKNFTTIEK